MGVFMQLFQSTISQSFNKLQVPYLCRNNANYLVYHKFKKKMIIQTLNLSKPKKNGGSIFQHFKLRSILKFNNCKTVNHNYLVSTTVELYRKRNFQKIHSIKGISSKKRFF